MPSGESQANDREIWRYALSVGAVILTKDEDFSIRKILEPAGPVIVCPAWEHAS